MIPTYIVTGFLGSGKSTYINEQLKHRRKLGGTMVIGTEQGTVPLKKQDCIITADELETTSDDITFLYSLKECILAHNPKEIWIEWNGMISFNRLESVLFSDCLKDIIDIRQVVYIATDRFVASMISSLGHPAQSQLYVADTVVLRHTRPPASDRSLHAKPKDPSHAKAVIRAYNPTAAVIEIRDQFYTRAGLSLHRPVPWGLYGIIAALTMYILSVTVFRHDIPYSLHQVFAIMSGMLLEGIPFLLLGTLIAAVIRNHIASRRLVSILRKPSWTSYGAAMGGGFLLPVCDCAVIPLFKALLDRNIPVHIALLFMISAPIVNPIVILSTWYAFPDKPWFVPARIILGLAIALSVSLSFRLWPAEVNKTSSQAISDGRNYIYEAGQFQVTRHNSGRQLILHIEQEFTQLLLYFSTAALLLSLFQVYLKPWLLQQNIILPTPLTIFLLLGLAFLFSLCSTSDAIIGKTLSTAFPLAGVLGFLILGPMIDIKNVYILQHYVSKRFITRLIVTVGGLTYAVSLLCQFLLTL